MVGRRGSVSPGLVHRTGYEGRERKNLEKEANRRVLQNGIALANILEGDFANHRFFFLSPLLLGQCELVLYLF